MHNIIEIYKSISRFVTTVVFSKLFYKTLILELLNYCTNLLYYDSMKGGG